MLVIPLGSGGTERWLTEMICTHLCRLAAHGNTVGPGSFTAVWERSLQFILKVDQDKEALWLNVR